MKKKLSSIKSKKHFIPIVAIGASAGGAEAITILLENLSSITGMAYIYIQTEEVAIDQLRSRLASTTTMPVIIAEENIIIEHNHLYIIPPGKEFIVDEATLKLNTKPLRQDLDFPIDRFFLYLAAFNTQVTVGILLSGISTDGILGLKAIKSAGGITFVQNESARFQNLPLTAVNENVVDRILSPVEIAEELTRLSTESNTIVKAMDIYDDVGGIVNNEDIVNIIQLLKKFTGVDFTNYKRNTIRRRIIRRMLLYKLQTTNAYYHYLKQYTNEINTLYQDLLINVTCFFRDPDTTEYIKKTVLPRLIKSKELNEPLRLWVPACSTGEEAYSLAMIILEVLGTRAVTTPIQIFATDLSEAAINKARTGLYSKNDLIDVSNKRIQRFFTKVDLNYRIIKSIRDMCVFAPHNVFKDPPFSRLDFVSCCNLFIYLEPVLQKKVMATFHYALNPNGFLMLGTSEALGSSMQLFTQLEKKYKVYIRKEGSSTAIFDMNCHLPSSKSKDLITIKNPNVKNVKGNPDDIEKMVDSILLSKYVPPSIIVNQDLEILQFRGSKGLFLEPSSGKASFNLIKMARPGLAFELRNIIHKANKLQLPIKKSGLQVKNKDAVNYLSIEAVPLKTENEERLFLITFEEILQPVAVDAKLKFTKDKLVKQLQDELNAVREDMRVIVEDQEASNEELQSANEEIVSSNEELQSINEELETSKEEVESTNEELITINQELQIRNDQLAESYEYAESVITTIREAILVLDLNLRVKNANRSFYKTFNLRENETDDQLVYEMGNGQWKIPELRRALETILDTNMPIQSLEIRHTFPEIGEKVMLINVRKIIQKTLRKEFILIAMEDITEHKQAEKIIAEREAWFRNTADSAPVMLWVAGTDKNCTFFNKTWLDFTGKTIEQELGNGWVEGVHVDDRELCMEIYITNFDERKIFSTEYRFKNKDGQYYWMMCTGKPTYTPDGKFTGYVGSLINIHTQKIFAEELEQRVKKRTRALLESNTNLERSNNELEQFAYVASHDLQEPLRKIRTFSDRLQSHFKEELPENARKYVDKIYDSSHRMSHLIDDLLNFSRVSKMQELIEVVDLNKILKSVLKNFDLAITENKIRINIENTLPQINAVPVQMIQLFHNLIGNAIKFSSPDKRLEITIASHMLSREEVKTYPQFRANLNYSEIVVSDNGIGFNQAYAEQIFIIFQRLNEKQKYPGTGIGLALCKKIVSNNGGTIYAKSEECKGASFHLLLPVV